LGLACASPQPLTLPPVIVSVSPLGGGISITKFPHPVQVFTLQDMPAKGPGSAAEALTRKAAGVNIVNSQGNPFQPTILYHGFEISPIQGTPAGLSVYVNGARFNQPFGDLAIWSALPEEAIASMTLEDGNPVFGLNALGGALNLRMNDGFTFQGADAELSGGSFGKWQTSGEYGKQSGNTSIYVAASIAHEAGWRDSQSSDLQNFYGDIGWRTAKLQCHLNATLAHSQLNGPGTVPVEVLAVAPATQYTGPNQIGDKYAKLSATWRAQLTPSTSLQTVVYYTNLRETLFNGNGPNDLPCGPDSAYLCEGGPGGNLSTARGGTVIPNFLPNANGYGYYAYSQLNVNTTNTNGYGASLQFTRTSSLNRLTAGASFDGGFTKYDAAGYLGGITQNSRVYYTPAGIPTPGYLLDEPGTVPVGVVIRNAYEGLYLSDTVNATAKLAITAGARYNLANIALHNQNAPDPNAPGGGLTGRHFYTHFNPALGATYALTPSLTIYGGYSQENAAPTPAELSCASPADSCSLANFMSGDPDLKQIITRSFEAGLRGTTPTPGDTTLSYNADYYNSITNDDIAFLQSPYNPVGEGYFSNIGNVARNGFDAGATLQAKTWQAYANYARINATYQAQFIEQSNNPQADANGTITINPGNHLPGIPANIIKFGVNSTPMPALTLGVSATAQTGTFLYGDEANLTKMLPGYFVVNLTASYQLTPSLQIFGEIDNVTDTRYDNYGTFSPAAADGGVYVAQRPDYTNPRSYSLAAPIGAFAGVKIKY
jgi:outer membrane receptor protein involved in Fe transport